MKKVLLLLLPLISCSAEKGPGNSYDYWADREIFEPVYTIGQLPTDHEYGGKLKTLGQLSQIPEISGLVESGKYPGYAWGIEDSGNPAQLDLIRLQDGKLVAQFRDTTIQNIDWEDIAAWQDKSGKFRLAIPDIGDNNAQRGTYQLYLMDEPEFISGMDSGLHFVDFKAFRKVFVYDDLKSRDAEALFIDRERGDFFIVSKRETRSRVFALKAENLHNPWDTAIYCGSFPFNYVTAADLSIERKLIIRTYTFVMVWEWVEESNLLQVLAGTPDQLPYDGLEPQGESAAWANQSKSYYLISEEQLNIPPTLHEWE
ncbi:MAG: hypothetical protein GC180_02590 [Bacteroidetes bacterium]|nr:hypothetical protein [Bacteroidota bacterium]